MARRNGSHEQRGERWVSVSSTWTAQPPPSWIPRANPKARRNPTKGAAATYLRWLAAYNNMPEDSFLPGGEYHRDLASEGVSSPAIQAAASPPPTPPVNLTEAKGQKAAAKIVEAAAKVVETKQQDVADSVEAIERNIAELNKRVFKTGTGKDWTKAGAGAGRPPKAYVDELQGLQTRLEAARRLQGQANTAAAVVEGSKQVTKTKKQKPADAVPVVVAAAQDATVAADQAQALAESAAQVTAEIAADAGVQVKITESTPSPLPPEVAAVEEDDDVALLAGAVAEQYAVPAPAPAPEKTEAQKRAEADKAALARFMKKNPRSRRVRGNGARRNPVMLNDRVLGILKGNIKKKGATEAETERILEAVAGLAQDSDPAPGQDINAFSVEFAKNAINAIDQMLAYIRGTDPGSVEVAEAIIETTPPAPVIAEVPTPAPSPAVPAETVAPVSRGPAVSGEGMTDAQLEAEIKKLINEVIDEMLGENVKSNPRRRR